MDDLIDDPVAVLRDLPDHAARALHVYESGQEELLQMSETDSASIHTGRS